MHDVEIVDRLYPRQAVIDPSNTSQYVVIGSSDRRCTVSSTE